MIILVEGTKYEAILLNKALDNSKFYIENNGKCIITHVGYYNSFDQKEIFYFLPKVFLIRGKVFDIFTPEQLLDKRISISFKHDPKYSWVRKLLYYFYKGLVEYNKRNLLNKLLHKDEINDIDSNIGDNEYSYIDLIITFLNFHKKNNQTALFQYVNKKAFNSRQVNWNRTIRKTIPIILSSNSIIYNQTHTVKAEINYEEELLIYFYSILANFKQEHGLDIHINPSYSLITGNAFRQLLLNGKKKLSKIKYKYFADVYKKMYRLCEIYFDYENNCLNKNRRYEYITISNYNLVFEDMVDKLFSDNSLLTSKEIHRLKYNKDGKIIDHIYQEQSLIDTSSIYYIGDSKYYKPNSTAMGTSIFKQFTYAKNVIQFNIDIFNKSKKYNGNLRYRDELTEGYNISPNFFIYGNIKQYDDFDNPNLSQNGYISKSFHYSDRVFDRDSLFIIQFQLNFLYILKSYTANILIIERFRRDARILIRNSFVDYFNNESDFTLYELHLPSKAFEHFITMNFKKLIGKCIITEDNKLIIAKHDNDLTLDSLLIGASVFYLS